MVKKKSKKSDISNKKEKGKRLKSNPVVVEKLKELVISEKLLPIELDEQKKSEKKGKFRIRSKKLFLTYPKLPELENMEEMFLESLKKSFGVKSDASWGYLIAQEKHLDGTPHIHVYLEFNISQGIYSRDKLHVPLKVDGEVKVCAGKYEAVKNHHHVIQYIIKTVGDFSDLKTNLVLPILSGIYYPDPAEHLHAVVSTLGYGAASEILMEQYPALAVTKGTTLLKNLEATADYFINKVNQKAVVVRPLSEFELPEGIQEWIDCDGKDRRTLVMFGPAGTGKTELAKSLLASQDLQYVIIRDVNALKGVSLSATMGLIFDDVRVIDKYREEMIHLLDTENPSDIRVLYGIARIPAGMARIFTTNNIREFNTHDKAISRRITAVEIPGPLWTKVTETEEITEIKKTTKTRVSLNPTVPSGTTVSLGTTDLSSDKTSVQASGEVVDVVVPVVAEKPAKEKGKRGRPVGSKNKRKK